MILHAAMFSLLPAGLQAQVAVFHEPGFPYYSGAASLPPRVAAEALATCGIEAHLLSAAELADPAEFNRERYTVLVHLYGNTFPLDALDNLKRFRAEKGCIVAAGVPFCHRCIQMQPADWHDNAPGTLLRDTNTAHAGRGCAMIRNPGQDWAGCTSPRFAARPGERFRISGWAKGTDLDTNRDYLFGRFFAGAFLGQDGPALAGSSDEWVSLAKEVTAPEGTTEMDVSFQVWSPHGTVWLDDVSVVRLDDGPRPQGFETQVPLPNPSFEEAGGGWHDLGHTDAYFGPDGIGMGSFGGPLEETWPLVVVQDNVIGLPPLDLTLLSDIRPQFIEPRSLPQAEVLPIIQLRTAAGPAPAPAALVRHGPGPLEGVMDLWLGTQILSQQSLETRYVARQTLVRGVAYILTQIGAMTPQQGTAVLARLDDTFGKPPEPIVDLEPVVEPRPYDTFFPRANPPAQHLVVADVTTLGPAPRLLLTSLQGLANRRQPQVYLVFNEHDRFWLDWMREKGYTGEPEWLDDPMDLLQRFADTYRGVVVTDPDLFIANNIACMIAAARDLLIATPELAEELGLQVRFDMRGRFQSNAEALRWAHETLYPNLSHHLLLCAHPNLAYNGTYDYFVQHKGVCFWITGLIDGEGPGCDSLEERRAMEEWFAEMPTCIPVRGFWWHGDDVGLGEGAGVDFGGQFGKITVVSDGIPNLSVHSGCPAPDLKQPKQPPPPVFDPSKVYVTFTMSDGDNLNTLYAYFRSYFESPEHGQFPMGWGLGPTSIDLMPAVAEWYYEHAARTDEFLADVSGVGYVFPQTFGSRYRDQQAVFEEFLQWTRTYMARVDQHCVRPHGGDRERMESYARLIPELTCIAADYGRRGGMDISNADYFTEPHPLPRAEGRVRGTDAGVPVFHALIGWGGGNEGMRDEIRERVGGRRPAFVNAFVWNWGFRLDDLQWVANALGEDYVIVTPSQMAALFRERRPQ